MNPALSLAATFSEPQALQNLSQEQASVSVPPPTPTSAWVMVDAHGFIKDSSPRAAAMLGYTGTDLNGRTLAELAFDGWQQAAGVAASRLRFGGLESFELALRGRSGRRSLIEMSVAPASNVGPGQLQLNWEERRGSVRRQDREHLEQQWREVYGLLQRQETERQHTVNRLHDDLLPTAVMAKYLLESLAQPLADTAKPVDTAQVQAHLRQATRHLLNLISGLRDISDELRPRMLDELGLYPALERLVHDQFPSGDAVHLHFCLRVPEDQIPAHLKLDIYRIIQAALANVRQHASASFATVSVIHQGTELVVSVEDDGVGFDSRQALRADSAAGLSRPAPEVPLSLTLINRRVLAHPGGRLILESRPKRLKGALVGGAWPILVSQAA